MPKIKSLIFATIFEPILLLTPVLLQYVDSVYGLWLESLTKSPPAHFYDQNRNVHGFF